MSIDFDLQLLDELYAKGDLKTAEEKLDEWTAQADDDGDSAALLSLYNELAGLYRVTGRAKQGCEAAEKALVLITSLGLNASLQHATTLLNAATVRRAAGDYAKAAEYYEKAGSIYSAAEGVDPYYIASLHNNISQLYGETGDFERAVAELREAQAVIDKAYPGSPEAATSRVNSSLYLMALGRIDEAEKALEEAMTYFGSPKGSSDGHFGAAMSAMGQLSYFRGDIKGSLSYYEKAGEFVHERFGESAEYKTICANIEKLRTM